MAPVVEDTVPLAVPAPEPEPAPPAATEPVAVPAT